ncbi:MAG: glycoside hydrolase family 99-like domain-containing protein [Terriglobales bacterium]
METYQEPDRRAWFRVGIYFDLEFLLGYEVSVERGFAMTNNVRFHVTTSRRFSIIAVLAFTFVACVLVAGQENGGLPASAAKVHSAPIVDAISPLSAARGGPTFTLSVVGSHFVPGSIVQWNTGDLPTTFVSNKLVTAAVPADALSKYGDDAISVINPDGGGVSNSLTFTVPCVIPPPSRASTQDRARLGAYYFDGWSGPLTNFHFKGLPLGPYQNRQPFSGWQDSNRCAVEEQLATAHNFGIDFFVFDWYFNARTNEPGDNLNSAIEITHSLPDRHGMQYAILYVDSPPFDVSPSQWPAAVNEWVHYMLDPAYARVNGKPVLFIIDVGEMYQIFGSDAAVANALAQLRAAAQAQGLPGVYVVGGFGEPDGTLGRNTLAPGFSIAGTDGYDAVALYNYPFAPPALNGQLPFSELSEAARWTWNEAEHDSSIPFVPTSMAGWDPRPWHEVEPVTGDLMWYARTPPEVAALVRDAIDWANYNPQLRPEPAPIPPLVLLEAWNEIGEGSHVVPTVEDGTSYGDAIAAMLLKK